MHIHRASGQTPSKNDNMLYVFCMQYRQRFKMSFLTASRMRSSTLFSKVYRNIVLPLCVTTTRRVRHKSTRQRRQHSWLLASTQLSWRSWKHWAISKTVWQPTHTIARMVLLMYNKIEQFRSNLYNSIAIMLRTGCICGWIYWRVCWLTGIMCADARMTYYVARFTSLFCVRDYCSVEALFTSNIPTKQCSHAWNKLSQWVWATNPETPCLTHHPLFPKFLTVLVTHCPFTIVILIVRLLSPAS